MLGSASPERPGVTEVPTALKEACPPLTLHCSIPLKVYWCQQPCKISVAKPCFLCWHNLPLDINRCVIAWSSTRACTFLIYGGKGNCSSALFGHVHSWRNSQNAREVCQMKMCLLANIKPHHADSLIQCNFKRTFWVQFSQAQSTAFVA